MNLNIVKIPNKILREKSKQVENINEDIKALINNMFDTIYENEGIGLSAVQVGKLLRIVVVDIGEKEKNPMIFINPKIISTSTEKQLAEEGCLSIPGQKANIMRNIGVEIEYYDIDMNKKAIKANGLLAHCLQHEIEHMDGILYIDHLSKLKRDNIIKKVTKKIKFNNNSEK
jgi:peptide deformylase